MKKNRHKWAIWEAPSFAISMLYAKNKNLELILNIKLDVGILEYEETEYFIDLVFKDGTKASLWNENKYYAWLSQGFIGSFRWRNSRPGRSTMRRLNYAINDFITKNV